MTTSTKTHASHPAKAAHAAPAARRVSAPLPTPRAPVQGARMTARVDQAPRALAASPAPAVAAPEPQAPAITSASSARADRGKPFEYQIEGTFEPRTFSADVLPDGLSVNPKGLISGKPNVAGEFRIKLGATNNVGTGSMTLTLTVA